LKSYFRPVLVFLFIFQFSVTGQQKSALEFYDTTGNSATCRFGWTGGVNNGHFFIESPLKKEVMTINGGNMSVNGAINAQQFIGDGSKLTNLPITTTAPSQSKIDSLGKLLNDKADKSELAQKANVSSLGEKADTSTVNSLTAKVNLKAGKSEIAAKADISALNSKADTSAISPLNAKINQKADISSLNSKADTSAVNSLNAKINLKADKTELASKADVSLLSTKADTGSTYSKSAISGLLSGKADLSGCTFTGSVSLNGSQNRSLTLSTSGLNFLDVIMQRTGSSYDVTWSQHMDYLTNLQFRAATTASGTKYPLTLTAEGSVGIGKTNVDNAYALDVGGDAYKSSGGTAWATSSDRRLKKISV
jgi:hypothetical protein